LRCPNNQTKKGAKKTLSREKDAYRDNLERIIERFPGKEILTYKQVAEFLGINDKTVRKYFKEKRFGGIPIVLLARMLS